MKTILMPIHISEIIEQYLNDQDVEMNFLYIRINEAGEFDGIIVDHDCEFKLPDTE